MTKVFMDLEFTGLHKNTSIISIGLLADNGEYFYGELVDYDKNQLDGWLYINIIKSTLWISRRDIFENFENHIKNNTNELETVYCGDKNGLRMALKSWFSKFNQIEIWGDCLAFDWVSFCDIFGTAFDIPKNIYYIPFDICTLFKENSIDPDINRLNFVFETEEEVAKFKEECKVGINLKHNSLWDARVIKACYEKVYKLKEANNDTR